MTDINAIVSRMIAEGKSQTEIKETIYKIKQRQQAQEEAAKNPPPDDDLPPAA